MRPSENRISIVSFRRGSKPEWWMPIPFFSNGKRCSTCKYQQPLANNLTIKQHVILHGPSVKEQETKSEDADGYCK